MEENVIEENKLVTGEVNELTEVEIIVDDILKDYDEILTRKNIAEIFGVSYHTVPSLLKKKEIKYTKEGEEKWKHIKIRKQFIRKALIEEYS